MTLNTLIKWHACYSYLNFQRLSNRYWKTLRSKPRWVFTSGTWKPCIVGSESNFRSWTAIFQHSLYFRSKHQKFVPRIQPLVLSLLGFLSLKYLQGWRYGGSDHNMLWGIHFRVQTSDAKRTYSVFIHIWKIFNDPLRPGCFYGFSSQLYSTLLWHGRKHFDSYILSDTMYTVFLAGLLRLQNWTLWLWISLLSKGLVL